MQQFAPVLQQLRGREHHPPPPTERLEHATLREERDELLSAVVITPTTVAT